ncbi:hypothetical protein L6R50_09035 [Myxococcota bacterium]|nr:hypothetical protein [Myxococcota bacterium]
MRPASFIRLTSTFEGTPLATLIVRGQPAWIARQVGAAIGYSHGGKRLPNTVAGEWSDEFVLGSDYDLLTGPELMALKTLDGVGTDCVPAMARSGILILFESGLHLVLAKTRKPVGVRLRRFLVDDVLPQLVRDGRYAPERTLVGGELVDTPTGDLWRDREARLARQLELRDRRFQASSLRRTVRTLKALGRIDDDTVAAYEIRASEIALRTDLPDLRGAPADDWLPPSRIATRLGATPQLVGRVITALGLRAEVPGLARVVHTKAPGHNWTTTSYLYSPEAVRRIDEALAALHKPPKPRR